MIKFLAIFLFFQIGSFLTQAHASQKPLYLHIEGEDPDHSPEEITAKLKTVFVLPLDSGKVFARRSWNISVQGQNHFFIFNLILEPLDQNSEVTFENYIKALESKSVLGNVVHFEPVQQIKGKYHLEIGDYSSQLSDPFVIKYNYTRSLNSNSFSEWEDFSNAYGFALLDKDHDHFRNYLLSFLSESTETPKITELLKVSDMMAIRSETDLFLQSGITVEQNSNGSPFLPFRFFRNCFQADYENGACF